MIKYLWSRVLKYKLLWELYVRYNSSTNPVFRENLQEMIDMIWKE